jgi:hypothetical protein
VKLTQTFSVGCARPFLVLQVSALSVVLAIITSCGGGGSSGEGGGSGGVHPTPDFSISVSPSSLSVPQGTEGTFSVALDALNGFSGSVQVQISGAPSGLTLSANEFNLSTQGQSVTVSASTTLTAGSYNLTFQATSGSLSHSAQDAVNITVTTPPPSRAEFVRTDDTPFAAAYDMARKLVYVSNPAAGTVDVISSTTYQLIKTLTIPSPAGLDMSLDGSTVYVGTTAQALYAIDATTQKIKQRYFAPPGQQPVNPKAAANGSLLMLSAESSGVYRIASWNLTTNTFSIRTDAPNNSFNSGGVVARSGNGQEVIFANNFDPGNVILYNSANDSFLSAGVPGYPFAAAANADGTQFAVAVNTGETGTGIYIFDAQLNLVTIVPSVGPLQYSPDGTSLYVVGFLGNVPVVQTINMQTFTSIGFAPAYATNIAYITRIPPLIEEAPLVADETGRVFGSADHGLAIDDADDLQPYTGSEPFPTDNIVVLPAEGPVGQQQNVQILTQSYTTAPKIWFGPLSAINPQVSVPYLTATAPGFAAVGPVNVRLIDTTGVQSFIPQGYTYGTVFAANPDFAASAAGAGTLNIFGYGLGVLGAVNNTQVTLGVNQAKLISLDYAAEQAYPFPLSQLQVQPPSMPTGVFDVKVSSATGTASLIGTYHSVDMNTYALDAQPYSIVYDGNRQQVYLATANHVDVFSLTTRKFLTPITVPTVNNLVQLGGMAMTPDNATLLVTNSADGSVALVNPDDPPSSKVASIVSPGTAGPTAVAASSTGKAFVNTAGAAYGFPQFRRILLRSSTSQSSSQPEPVIWELDLNTLVAAPVPVSQLSGSTSPSNVTIKASDDGTKICFVGEYQNLSIYDSASDTFTQSSIQGLATCAIDGNGLAMSGYPTERLLTLSDASLDFNGYASMTDYTAYSLFGPLTPIALGVLVDPSGALAYQTTIQEIAIVDMHTGQLRERIALPMKTEFIEDGAIARDQTGLLVFAITDSGLTVIQLDSLPIAVGNVSTVGTSWTISGTGFQEGATVSADASALNTSFISSQSLQVAAAPDLNTVEELTVTNPDGRSYTIEAAYLR